MPPTRRVTNLAEALADRERLDWDSAQSQADDQAERDTIGNLHIVSRIAGLFARLGAVSFEQSERRRRLLAPGDLWGNLRIIEHVGAGRFGDVYRAWDSTLEREVALKLLDDRGAPSDPDVVHEGRLMARVRHPNVVTIYGAQRVDGVTGLWMEFVEGRTLAAELAEGAPVGADELARIGIGICHSLTAVHAAGLVHRDVKAQNVMRDANGRIVLGDFGTGRDRHDELAAPGALAGTPAYLAPEIFAGAPASPQSDLYSLGVLLFHLATGSFPVAGRTMADVREAHARGDRWSLAATRPDLPRDLVRAVERALSPMPGDRFTDAGAMAHALGACLPEERQRRQHSVRVGVMAAVLAAILISFGVWVGTRPPVRVLPFQERDWVLITAFENRTGEAVLNGTLEYALQRELGAASFVNVVPRERINDTLRLMQRPLETPIDVVIGREIALRDGEIRALIGGRVEKMGGTYALAAQILKPADGSVVASVSDEAREQSDLVPAIQRISLRVRELLGERLASSESSREPLQKVTTTSLRALQLYSNAAALVSRWDTPGVGADAAAAEQLLLAAIQEDPDFASAHILLAYVLRSGPLAKPLKHAERAVALGARTTETERLFIAGTHHALVSRSSESARIPSLERAAGAYEALLKLQPDHYWALNYLGPIYSLLGRGADAARVFERLAAVRPNNGGWQGRAAMESWRVGNIDRARDYAARARALVALDQSSGDHFTRAWAMLFPAHEAWLEGDVRRALAAVDEVAASVETVPAEARVQFGMQILYLYLTLGRLDQAAAIVDSVPLRSVPGQSAWQFQARALILAERGDVDRLRGFLIERRTEELERVASLVIETGLLDLARTVITGRAAIVQRGQLALAEGRIADGISLLEEAVTQQIRPENYPFLRASRLLGAAWRAQGDVDKAIQVLERASEQPRRWSALGWSGGFEWLKLRALLSQLYRESGRLNEAEAVDDELRTLLAVADEDHPLVLALRKTEAKGAPVGR